MKSPLLLLNINFIKLLRNLKKNYKYAQNRLKYRYLKIKYWTHVENQENHVIIINTLHTHTQTHTHKHTHTQTHTHIYTYAHTVINISSGK